MDLIIKFKNEPKVNELLYCNNVDALTEYQLDYLYSLCENTLIDFKNSTWKNESIQPSCELEYQFLDKSEILSRKFNKQNIIGDIDFAKGFSKNELEQKLLYNIKNNYKKTNNFWQITGGGYER